MGKRSRKHRAEGGAGTAGARAERAAGSASTRAERDAARARAATRDSRAARDARRTSAGRRGTREAPPAPWGSFPLTELVVLIALVFGVIGFIRFEHHTGKVMVAAAMVLGSLGGLEVSVREHFAGYRSHTTLLAASVAVGSMILISVIAGKAGLAILALVVGVGVLVFVLAFYGLRQAFVRRSGGLGFR